MRAQKQLGGDQSPQLDCKKVIFVFFSIFQRILQHYCSGHEMICSKSIVSGHTAVCFHYIYVTDYGTENRYLCFPTPGPNLHLTVPVPICIQRPWPSSCIYRTWLVKIGNNKNQVLDIMLLSLFLRVVVDKKETQRNLTIKSDYYNASQTKGKKSEIN